MKTMEIPSRARTQFGLIAILKNKRVVLPLKGVDCSFTTVGGLAEVKMTQIFRQENSKPLDCEYLFPLPADAAVYSCEADINGRTIRAQVREREEARRLAAEKKAEGFRTALVEAERENLFTFSLGNIQPQDLVLVELKYVQPLRSVGLARSIEIPFCPGVRYIPGRPLLRSNRGKGVVDDTDQVPDASRITPVRVDAEHPDAAYVDVRGTLDGKFVNDNDLLSPSHSIEVSRAGDELRLALSDKAAVPDRDFVLRWREQHGTEVASRAWLSRKGEDTYALLEVRAPQAAAASRSPVDFYFLVDRSGSMQGKKWEKAAEALLSCVQTLGAADRAMVTFFESQFMDFAEEPLPVSQLLEDTKFQEVSRLGTAGGTELAPALRHVLEVAGAHSRDREKNLVLITDAQVGNEGAILKVMKAMSDLPVHCFGIDNALNDSLLAALCRQQGGTFCSLNPGDDIRQALTDLGKTLGQPVLLNLELPSGWELAEGKLPSLYAGQIHYASARTRAATPLELKARDATSGPVTIRFETQPTTTDAPYLHWCRARIRRWIAEGHNREAIDLSVQSNLICPLTAFLAWDEAEKVPVASEALVQPDMMLKRELLASDALLCRCYRATDGLSHSLMDPGAVFERLFSHSETPETKELEVRRNLSDLCHRVGLPDWQRLVNELFDKVAAAKGVQRAERLTVAMELVEEVEKLVEQVAGAGGVTDAKRLEQAQVKIRKLLEKALADMSDLTALLETWIRHHRRRVKS